MFVPRGRTWTDEQLAAAVPDALSISDVLRALGLRIAGGNPKTIRRHVQRLGLDTSHFDGGASKRRIAPRAAIPLVDVLVEHSSYSRTNLKRRLYAEGLKARACELCGQGELWNGRSMSLILDHINGVHDDNRLENLRIVCANCNATLETHCGRNTARPRELVACDRCRRPYERATAAQRFCSKDCGTRGAPGDRAGDRPTIRRITDRPPLDELRARIDADGYAWIRDELGVSDNAVRKWFRSAGQEPPRRHGRGSGP